MSGKVLETSGKFVCKNLGNCCTNPAAPVNLSVGDLLRIMKYTHKTAEELFGHAWSGVPFGNPVNKLSYSVEPGLDTPCHFWRNGKCSIYKARPINCRLFPYWILAEIPKDHIKENFTREDLCCAYNCHPSNEQKKKYKRYVNHLGKIIEKEAIVTQEILITIKLKKFVELPKTSTEFFNDFLGTTFSGAHLSHFQAEHQIQLAKTLYRQEDFLPLAKYVDIHAVEISQKVASQEELDSADRMVL
jgi:Fe-S-cluster containining protein